MVEGLYALVGAEEAQKLTPELAARFAKATRFIDYAAWKAVDDEVNHRIHTSSMSKLGDDGKPLRREDGKILKGPNYAPVVSWTSSAARLGMSEENRKRLLKLEALEAAGVDNWESYGWALELYQEYLEYECLEDA